MSRSLLAAVENVTKVFQEDSMAIKALNGVSLEIEPGAFTALSGPSGSGKTTLLNLLGCLDKSTSGEIRLEGEPISRLGQEALTRHRLKKIGFIFQDYNLIPTLTAMENIEYILWLQGAGMRERREKAIQICKRFSIDHLLGRRPWQLSRGQQQRVAVARALVHSPRLVLGDELTANLDHTTGKELMVFLKELNQKEGISFVYATHDPVMLDYATKVIRLQDGQVVDSR